MTRLEILTYPDQRLEQTSQEVEIFDEKLRQFVSELDATRLAAPGCVGIASPQVNEFVRVVIVDVSGKKKIKSHGRLIMVNPEITAWDGFEVGREGCLSVPDYTGNVIRAQEITLSAMDEHGKPFTIDAEGFEARAIQHEIDHLDGLLFLDRLVSRRNDLFKRKVYKKD
jgi:peptide deformylase